MVIQNSLSDTYSCLSFLSSSAKSRRGSTHVHRPRPTSVPTLTMVAAESQGRSMMASMVVGKRPWVMQMALPTDVTRPTAEMPMRMRTVTTRVSTSRGSETGDSVILGMRKRKSDHSPSSLSIMAADTALVFQCMDCTYVTDERTQRPVLRLTGMTAREESVLVHARGFLPYFYVRAPPGGSPSAFRARLEVALAARVEKAKAPRGRQRPQPPPQRRVAQPRRRRREDDDDDSTDEWDQAEGQDSQEEEE